METDLLLYHCPLSRSVRPLWLFEEMGLPYRLETHPFEYFGSEEFRFINPLGQMPILIDNGEVITESTVIMEYLLNRYGPSNLSVDVQHEEYARYLEWLHKAEAGMCHYLSILLGHRIVGEGSPYRVTPEFDALCEAKVGKYTDVVAQQLQGREFLLKQGFSAADISLGFSLYLTKTILELSLPDIVDDYYTRLQARPAWVKAIAEE